MPTALFSQCFKFYTVLFHPLSGRIFRRIDHFPIQDLAVFSRTIIRWIMNIYFSFVRRISFRRSADKFPTYEGKISDDRRKDNMQ